MRFSTAFAFALFILPVVPEVSAGAIFPRQRQGKNNKGTGATPPAANTTSPAGAEATTPVADTGVVNAKKGNGGDPQTSLSKSPSGRDQSKHLTNAFIALDPRVVAAGFAQNGQNPPVAGMSLEE